MKKLLFESQTCTRCHGSGKHSFNLRHGDMCYGCNGSGVQLTKRGIMAQKYFREMAMVPVSELVVGDTIRQIGITNGGDTYSHGVQIESVGPSSTTCICNGVERQYVEIRYTGKTGEGSLFTFPDHKVEVLGRDRKQRIERALAYQATLNKAGKPYKRTKFLKEQDF